jgi:hypothetical protein
MEKSAVWKKRKVTRVCTAHKAKKCKEAHFDGRTWPAKQFLGRAETFLLKKYPFKKAWMAV